MRRQQRRWAPPARTDEGNVEAWRRAIESRRSARAAGQPVRRRPPARTRFAEEHAPGMIATLAHWDRSPSGQATGVVYGVLPARGMTFDPALAFSYRVARQLSAALRPERDRMPGLCRVYRPDGSLVCTLDPFTRRPVTHE